MRKLAPTVSVCSSIQGETQAMVVNEAFYDLFHVDGTCELLTAFYDGQPLASLFELAKGERAYYLYGASSDLERNRMPAYLIQWEAMKWAKGKGCRSYDMWGIPDDVTESSELEESEREDGLWGVYRFKRGFGGQVVRYVGMVEKSLSPLYPLAMRLRHLRGAGRGGPTELS